MRDEGKIFSNKSFKCMFASMKIKIFIFILVILYAGHPEHTFAKEEVGSKIKIFICFHEV
ncbi:MAG: hypothetical protein CM1200mP30_33750 [Pseudomonadota bacterium]|nr:MAG: hypothetical protein CM1200mP30_33750 [Pseudomonadota bacterium]